MSKQRLVIAFGGRSVEHDISVRSATEVLAVVDRQRYEPVLLGVRRDGSWCTGASNLTPSEVMTQGRPVSDVRELTADVVFPLLHGPYGEDGCFQGLLETHGIAYVGSGVFASALCMSKTKLKHFVRGTPFNVPVVPWLEHDCDTQGSDFSQFIAQVETRFGYPCFVKPDRQGSSLGMTRATDRSLLEAGLLAAARLDAIVLVEPALHARELEIAVLGSKAELLLSSPGEIVVPRGSWYDFDTKYINDVAELHAPARLNPHVTERLQALARQTFVATDCYGLARIDFLYDEAADSVYLNEPNTLPGFTSISMYPRLMAHAGVTYPELVQRLCDLALERRARQRG